MQVPVYDIINCGPRNRFGANGKLVHNSQKINMQNLSGNKPVNERTPVGAIIVTPRGIDRLKKYNKKTGQLMCSDGTILSNKGKQFCYFDGRVVDASTPLGTQIMTPRGPDTLKDYHLETGQVMCADGTVFSNRGDEFCHVAGLRDTIVAPPGKRLVVADSSQIELRVAHLLAGQMDTVAELRAGIDVYSSFASTVYNRPITKADKKERQHGKVGMLQLQYQSGWKSFRNAARIMGGVRLTEDEAKGTVDVYRNRFTQLPMFWRKCQQAIPKMAKGGGGYIDQWGLCKLEAGKITMPGRMPLVYHNLREELLEGFNGGPPEMQWVYDDKEKRRMKKIYGGSVTENLCQWIARHVVFDQMLECERRWGSYGSSGNGVVLTVHDEIVMCVDEDDADECLAFSLGVMGQPPVWWKDLPVAAEGGIGIRYSEAK